ncbi:hypothetical protein [Pontibacter pudoricolor]|uniref:hypothetical protein n=1 Tax=Pontibacter pudoricolor TaxID=2694930 RepID=UPI0013915DB4|nr:hypothetical protein [Pontibacter pudoricolor]
MYKLAIIFVLLLQMHFVDQDKKCCSDELYYFLLEKGVATKGDRNFIWCKPIVKESNGDGIFAFGVNETDSFTFFYLREGGKINILKNRNIDDILHNVSTFLKDSPIPLKDKVTCYQEILDVIKAENLDNEWALPNK